MSRQLMQRATLQLWKASCRQPQSWPRTGSRRWRRSSGTGAGSWTNRRDGLLAQPVTDPVLMQHVSEHARNCIKEHSVNLGAKQ